MTFFLLQNAIGDNNKKKDHPQCYIIQYLSQYILRHNGTNGVMRTGKGAFSKVCMLILHFVYTKVLISV